VSTHNPLLKRASSRGIGHNGRVSENSLAKRLGGTLTPASGAMAGAKGDIRLDDFLIEAKATQAASMSLQQDWLYKVYQEALELSKSPALAITFTSPTGSSSKRDRWVMVPESVFQELVEKGE